MSDELTPARKNTKKALGRGLGSLLGEVAAANADEDSGFERVELKKAVPAQLNTATAPAGASVSPNAVTAAAAPAIPEHARIWTVAIEKIVPNKEQPRKTFDPVRLQELANSIKEKGILLPIVVRRVGDKFEIIAGERRWRAAQVAGGKEVPVIIRQTENKEALELALIENIQRQDLNPLEEAEAYLLLTTRYGLTQQQVADRVGKERATVANLLRLMGLTAEVKNFVRTGELQLGQAKVLLAIEDPVLQVKLAKKVVQLKMSVRATETLVSKAKTQGETDLEIDDKALQARDVRPLMSELQKMFGTKVDIETSGEKSKVSFHLYSAAELNQFMDRIRKISR